MIKNGRLYFDPKKNSLANWLTSVICGNKGGISLKKFNRIMSIEECEKYLQKQIDKYNEYVENGWVRVYDDHFVLHKGNLSAEQRNYLSLAGHKIDKHLYGEWE